MCEVWGSATRYGYERLYVSSYYQYACAQCMGAAAEHLQGRAWPAFLIPLLGGYRSQLHFGHCFELDGRTTLSHVGKSVGKGVLIIASTS